MGNENHYRHQHHHQFYHQNLHHIHHHRSTFLPMLCSRPSIKDVSLPRWRDRAGSSCDDPLSPRIGCMGQVKRNNKIAGFPTSHRLSLITSKSSTSTSTSTSTSPVVKYSKLKKLFSAKNLKSTTTTPTTTTTTTTTNTTMSSCGSRQQRVADVPKNQRCSRNIENVVSISIEDMDPPLPVIKRVHKMEVDSLWQRRAGGHALKSLQLQQIHHPRICLQPTSV